MWLAPLIVPHDLHEPLGEAQGRLDRIGQTSAVLGARNQPIDDHRDIVILAAVELRRFGEFNEFAVHHRAHEALLAGILEQLPELTLAPAHERREHLDLGARGPRQHDIGNLRRRLLRHRATAIGAMRRPGARVEQAQVVVDLGDGANGGTRIGTGGLLLDGDRGRQALDDIDVRLLHQPKELAGVRRERLDVAALPFGEDGVEGERGLPGTREPGHHRQAVPGDRHADVLQIVFARAAHDQGVTGHSQVSSLTVGVYGRRGELSGPSIRGAGDGRPSSRSSRGTPAIRRGNR